MSFYEQQDYWYKNKPAFAGLQRIDTAKASELSNSYLKFFKFFKFFLKFFEFEKEKNEFLRWVTIDRLLWYTRY